MAKVSSNPIPDLNADWGNDGTGLPYSGEAVQTFIKDELKDRLTWEVKELDVTDPTIEESYVKTTTQILTDEQKETVIANLGLEEFIGNAEINITVDTQLDPDSSNPVQNKVIYEAINLRNVGAEDTDESVEEREVKDAVDLTTKEKIYFKGHAKATYLSDGRNVEDALAEIPSGESSLFEVVYGETPYNDIIAASKARKHVICYYKDFIYNLTKCQEGYDLKFSCADVEVLTIICKVNGGWSASNAGHEVIINKVTSLSEKSTNTQYPSAKAVYDFVQTTLGTIINGDY